MDHNVGRHQGFSLQALLGKQIATAVVVVDNAKSPAAPMSLQRARREYFPLLGTARQQRRRGARHSLRCPFPFEDSLKKRKEKWAAESENLLAPRRMKRTLKRVSSMDDLFREESQSQASATHSSHHKSTRRASVQALAPVKMPVRFVSPRKNNRPRIVPSAEASLRERVDTAAPMKMPIRFLSPMMQERRIVPVSHDMGGPVLSPTSVVSVNGTSSEFLVVDD